MVINRAQQGKTGSVSQNTFSISRPDGAAYDATSMLAFDPRKNVLEPSGASFIGMRGAWWSKLAGKERCAIDLCLPLESDCLLLPGCMD